jgi:hypothetical protein
LISGAADDRLRRALPALVVDEEVVTDAGSRHYAESVCRR